MVQAYFIIFIIFSQISNDFFFKYTLHFNVRHSVFQGDARSEQQCQGEGRSVDNCCGSHGGRLSVAVMVMSVVGDAQVGNGAETKQ
jgi:hypothetical protein